MGRIRIVDPVGFRQGVAGGGGGASPATTFNPDDSSTDQELINDPVFSDTEPGGNYSLDTSVGYPGGSNSMVYTWVDQDCQTISIGREIPIPGRGSFSGTTQMIQELWVEFWLRWSTNFQQNVDPNCAPDLPAHKLLFVQTSKTDDPTPGNHGRWALTWNGGGGVVHIEAPHEVVSGDLCGPGTGFQCNIDSLDGHQYFDGNWHKFRIHFRQDPGLYGVEVDGGVVINKTGFTVDPAHKMFAVQLGKNKDEGNPAPSTETLHWGKMDIYTSAPGGWNI